ncbi:MAG: NUDIX domain-containing protein [Clostridia bacterium]|nr:NUDIX domain-containing protein [Clostridia bacterium]
MERFDVLDEKGALTGKICTREQAHALGLWHRTAHVWIARFPSLLLLQKRSSTKDSYPGCWDISSAGHLDAGEEPLHGAERELKEELGITAAGSRIRPIGVLRSKRVTMPRGIRFIDREFAHIFLLETDILPMLSLQREEVSEVRWFPAGECLRAASENDPAFCLMEDEVRLVCSSLGSSVHS